MKDKEISRLRCKVYYYKNKEKRLNQIKKWNQENIDKYKSYKHKYLKKYSKSEKYKKYQRKWRYRNKLDTLQLYYLNRYDLYFNYTIKDDENKIEFFIYYSSNVYYYHYLFSEFNITDIKNCIKAIIMKNENMLNFL